ncbi:AraC family transcriptional regulator [Catenuloplanes atrovinosus]|uniref:AraC-like DNA-binding protein n=1 Tax=Catenuloplanes atrovinosus TaxID=137266 RepID=A0AAE3YPC3_9ACTN|nr:AraC family transcriptional regulator [Catenuloplanes atrovinosus]MDR7277538.1 AraC-like DNA-binding protein [Catenuloplanes atrovinosus]
MDRLAELRELIPHLDPARGAWLPHAGVMREERVTEPTGSVTRPLVALTVSGRKRTTLPGHEFDYAAGQYLVTSVGLPLTAQLTEVPYLAFGMELRPEVIAELLLRAPSPAPAARAGLGIAIADAAPELLDAVLRLLRLVDRPDDFAVLAPAVEREIHWWLLRGPLGGLVRQVGRADARAAVARDAAAWINEHFTETIRIADLARHVGVSAPTLNRYFRELTGMSPVRYQKQLRLQLARVRLAAAPDDVAAAGFAVGYDSPSQFSREYRRLFGRPPGEDARRLQDAAPGS